MVDQKEFNKIITEYEKIYGLNHYEVLQRFMFESFLKRLSESQYKDNFILKGGLLLSSIFGIDNRTTRDIDASISGISISEDKMISILKIIFNINLKDGVTFEINSTTSIREEDCYGGIRFYITGKIFHLKVNFEIDISTGDVVTYGQLNYEYKLLFEDKTTKLRTYNIETILAEKIETILRRGKFNSRMKDFYDVYMILTKYKYDINKNMLRKAFLNTFNKRNSLKYLEDYDEILRMILLGDQINYLWKRYSIKYYYANGITMDEIINLIKQMMQLVVAKIN